MNKQEAFELVPLYALGALDEAEINEFEQLLAQDVTLRTELDEYIAVVDELPLFVSAHPAPNLQDKLRQRIREQDSVSPSVPTTSTAPTLITQIRRHQKWLGAIAAVLAILLVGIALLNFFADDDKKSELTTAQLIDNILKDPNQRRFAVEPKEDFGSIAGALIVDKNGKFGVLQLEGVTALPEDQDFQLWFIINGEDRVSGGVFDATDDHTALHFVELPDDFDAFEAAGVTVEPKGGSPAPTGASVLSAPLIPSQ